MFTSNQGDLSVQYYDPESKRLRKYYPDFLALMEDGSYQLIEVKGDNKIDDEVVLAKKAAAAFDDEPATVAMMDKYLEENGYVNDFTGERRHHEIYLSDPRKVAPEKCKTVIRHPIKKA